MAHRALTLKYRPQVFADLVGQDHVTRVLSAALESGRVAQAFLFTGARGVGKTTSARILAKALNCEQRGLAAEEAAAARGGASSPARADATTAAGGAQAPARAPATPAAGGPPAPAKAPATAGTSGAATTPAAPAAGGRGGSGAGRESSHEPCNECTSCREIASGVSLDVLEIDGASNRGIADVQQLRENVRFTPTGGRYRVVIIDEVHQLSGDAFAALLKTLEEPPPHLVFIFATTDPQKLPDTIRSRTQRFDFARVPIRRVADRLLEIQKREAADADGVQFTLTDGAALLIAHKGEGSMRDAVSALDQVVSAGEPAIDEPLVRRVLGIPDREAYFLIAGAVLGRDPQGTLRELHAAFARGVDPRELAEGLAEHFRNILVLKVDPTKGHELVAASNEELARLAKQGEGWQDTDLLRLMRLAAECQWPMRDSPQPLVHLEAAVLQMATLEPAESVAALLERLEALEQRLAGGAPAATPARAATPPRAGAPARTHGFATAPAPPQAPQAGSPPASEPSVPPAPSRAAPPAPSRAAPPAPSRAATPAPAPAPSPPAATPAPGFTPPRASVAPPPPGPASAASSSVAAGAPPAPASVTAATGTLLEEAQLDGAVEDCWKRAIAAVNGRKRMLGAFLEEIRLVGLSGGALVLAMDDLHRSVIDSAEHRPIVTDELARAFGRPLEMRCTAGTPSTPETRAAKADSLKPLIERAMQVFEGEVIERAPRAGDRST